MPTTLKNLGLCIQLGHPVGQQCTNLQAAGGDDFVIIERNGIHTVGLDFCGCDTAVHHCNQLLRALLFPATVIAPHTAATFNMLQFFHLLTFESKASVFEFHNTLSRCTDNTGTVKVPVNTLITSGEAIY